MNRQTHHCPTMIHQQKQLKNQETRQKEEVPEKETRPYQIITGSSPRRPLFLHTISFE